MGDLNNYVEHNKLKDSRGGKSIALVLDENFNVFAVDKGFSSCFKNGLGNGRVLEDIFTKESIELLKTRIKNSSSSYFKITLSSIAGRKCQAYVVTLLGPDNKNLYLIDFFEGDSGGEDVFPSGLVSEEADSVAFLLMGLAHEIKNPLAGIKVIVDMLECECDGKSEVKNYLSRISKNVDRVNSMLEVFFSYAKINAETKEVFPVSSFIEDLLLFQGYKIKKEGIDFSVNEEDKKLFIVGNRNQILNVFLNLLNNATDSVIESGKVRKEIELSVRGLERTPVNLDKSRFSGLNLDVEKIKAIEFTLKDNGIGMSDFEKKHIFNPFFTTKDKGVGLGMSMVAKYLEENCGEISFESEKGKGSVFKIVLPGVKGF